MLFQQTRGPDDNANVSLQEYWGSTFFFIRFKAGIEILQDVFSIIFLIQGRTTEFSELLADEL